MADRITQFARAEICTAAIDAQHPSTGDRLFGPLLVGYYPLDAKQQPSEAEVWVECEGRRVHVTAAILPALVRQLRRAVLIAQENRNG